MNRPRPALLVLLVAVALMAPGCGALRESSEMGPTAETVSPPAVVSAQADPRSIVFTAALTVRVVAVGRATTDTVRIARDAGGFVFAQTSDLQGRREARLTLKVPPERFEPVLADLAGLGRALKSEAKAQDVTDEVTDVEGRLKTARASADRLRALLGAAPSTADIVVVEGELAKREGDIEALQGRLRVVTDQVGLATINVRLTESADLAVDREVPGFLTALRTGWVALLNVTLGAMAAVGFLLPFVPLGLLGRCLVRRHRSRQPRRTRPWPPSFPPPAAPTSPGRP